MLSQVVTNKDMQDKEAQQEWANTSGFHEFLRMNPHSFTTSSTTEDLEDFVKELKKAFGVMHVVDVERVELVSYS